MLGTHHPALCHTGCVCLDDSGYPRVSVYPTSTWLIHTYDIAQSCPWHGSVCIPPPHHPTLCHTVCVCRLPSYLCHWMTVWHTHTPRTRPRWPHLVHITTGFQQYRVSYPAITEMPMPKKSEIPINFLFITKRSISTGGFFLVVAKGICVVRLLIVACLDTDDLTARAP